MSRVLDVMLCSCCLIAAGACSEGQLATPTTPSPAVRAETSPPPTLQPGTITFDALTEGEAVADYEERGFTLHASGGNWQAGANYGNPRPFIRFTAQAGETVVGELRVTGGGATFTFKSVDLYASTTPIPYAITGTLAGAAVFTLSGRLPNTFGQFRIVSATDPAAVIDALTITLTNSAAPCCTNPMGLDNIVLDEP